MERTMKIEDVKVSEWINCYLHLSGDNIINIDNCKYADMFYFTILWNLFEARIFDYCMDCNVEAIRCKVKNKIRLTALQAEPIINILLEYLQNRYTTQNSDGVNVVNHRFEHLTNKTRTPKACSELLSKVLCGENADKADVITAIIIAIYRFRCNLFHGEKEIASLPADGVDFCDVNRFIIACLVHKK